MTLPQSKLVDELKDKTKQFNEIADENAKNLFVAREESNKTFIETLTGNETTIGMDLDIKQEREFTISKVEVKRGLLDDVIGANILWQ